MVDFTATAVPFLWVMVAVGILAVGAALARAVRLGPAARREQADAAVRHGVARVVGRQRVLALAIGAVVVAALAVLAGGASRWWSLGAYLAGAGAALGVGGGVVAVTAHSPRRTADAAADSGSVAAMTTAVGGGTGAALVLVGVAATMLAGGYLLADAALSLPEVWRLLVPAALGVSTVAIVARVGSGVFAKSTDVASHTTSPLDARDADRDGSNPVAIADLAGDSLADANGAAIDLLDTLFISAAAATVLAWDLSGEPSVALWGVLLPLVVAASGIVGSFLAALVVRTRGSRLSATLRLGPTVCGAYVLIVGYTYLRWPLVGTPGTIVSWGAFVSLALGVVVGIGIGHLSELFTSDRWRQVKNVARQADRGAAPVVLAGVVDGLRTSVILVAVLGGGVAGAYWGGEAMVEGGGAYGVALGAVAAAASLGVIARVSAFGPVADTARGLADMTGMPVEAREVAASLDSLGNAVAGMVRGFSLGAGGWAAVAAILAFHRTADIGAVDLFRPLALGSLLLGAAVPMVVAASAMRWVTATAASIVDEAGRRVAGQRGRRKTRTPVDEVWCIDLAAAAADRAVVLPISLAVVLPIGLGLFDIAALATFLVGGLVSGLLLAALLASSGGSWDNARKLVEAGAYGGRGSDAHLATSVGDAVGDPFKDAAMPAVLVVVKGLAIAALAFLPAFLR
ncbi:MAG TPA: sodium/proton-translocating pyrophosphatase [Acidimicrobiia bacterium]|nr:sodium/proton-translocating pyrophosphatase [Acidimicrobiia bacterium]